MQPLAQGKEQDDPVWDSARSVIYEAREKQRGDVKCRIDILDGAQ